MQWKVLAGLRFLLAWIVVSEHIQLFINSEENNFLFAFRRFNAFSAILSFLLISGYSIANSIILKPEGFYKRRILRIYPLYFCSVLFSLIPFCFLGSTIKIPSQEIIQPDLWTVAGNLFFLQGWLVKPLQSNTPLWTLSIGVFCYLLTPIIIKMSRKTILKIFVVFSFLYVFFPHLYQLFFPSLKFPFYAILQYGLPFILLFWSWLLGFLCFYKNDSEFIKFLLIGLGFLILVLNRFHTGRSGIITYLIAGLVLIYSPNIRLPEILNIVLNYLGKISYPLYLFHVPSFILAYSLLGIKDSSQLAFFAFLTSVFFYHTIDVTVRLQIEN